VSVLAAYAPSPVPFILLMVLGFLVGAAGHAYKSPAAVATGIGLIFIATLLLPLGLYLSAR
jgi:purine-cytosine permease-like protein